MTEKIELTKEQAEIIDINEIVEDWLQENGYDGFYYPGECACKSGDIACCGNRENIFSGECLPGVLTSTRPPDLDIDDDCQWYIVKKEIK